MKSVAAPVVWAALALLWPRGAASAETCAIGGLCEAESAQLGGGVVAGASYAGHTGEGFAHYTGTGSGWVEWTVGVPSAGLYTLRFRYAHGGAEDRPLSIRVNGAVVNDALSFPVTSWTDWAVITQAVRLPAGAVRVRAVESGNGPNLDSLTVIAGAPPTPAPTAVARPTSPPTPPSTGCAIDAVCEAETARLGGGAAPDTIYGGYTGIGFADYTGSGSSHGFIEWTLNVPAAGTYALSFRYANGGTGDRPLEIRVDGTVVSDSLSFPVTGWWTGWMVRSLNATLPAGTVRIRATEKQNGPNVDNLTVTAGPAPQSASRGTSSWAPNVEYAVGAVVTDGEATYRCRKAHTSQVGWEPPNAASLWEADRKY